MVIANVFPKLQTVKNFVRPFCKKRRFGTRSYSQDVEVCQVLAKSPLEHFYHVFSSFGENLIGKISPLVLGKILGVFLNTLTSDDKYPVEDSENFQLPMQMQLSEKRKTFFEFFFHFWKLHQILNILKSRMMVIANVFPKLQTVKGFDRPTCKKRLRNTLWETTCESVPNTWKISMRASLIWFSIIFREVV